MKRHILTCSIFLIYLLIHSHLTTAQVAITQATGGTNICIDNPISTPISNIVISETTSSDIGTITGGTFVLTLTSGFEWAGSPSVSIMGSDLSNASVSITGTNNTALQIIFNCTTTTSLDIITLANLQIRAVNPPSFGQAIIITRLAGTDGGNVSVNGSLNADYGILSSTAAPNSFIIGLSNCYNPMTSSILLSALPTIAGATSSFSLQYISGPGSAIAGVTLSSSGTNYYFNPSSITGLSSTAGTVFKIIFSSTLSGTSQCISNASQVVTVNSNPQIDFTLPGSIGINDPPLILAGTPSGGNFSGEGVTGNTFDTRLVTTSSYPITYTATDVNGCSGSVTKSITVVSSTDIINLKHTYCELDGVVTPISFINGFPTNFVMGSYELVYISGPGITGTTDGVNWNYTYQTSLAVSDGYLDYPYYYVYISTRRWVFGFHYEYPAGYILGYYWNYSYRYHNYAVYSKPAPPTVAYPTDSNCVNSSPKNYVASGGASIRWWDNGGPTPNAAGTGQITSGISKSASDLGVSNTSPSSQIKRITQDVNGCISDPTSFSVNVYANPSHPNLVIPLNTTSAIVNYNLCQNSNQPTLSVVGTSLASFKWYSSSTFTSAYDLGSLPQLTPSLTQLNTAVPGTTNFYAAQIVNGCETPSPGLLVSIHIISTPSAPILSSYLNDICNTSPFPSITANVSNGANKIKWYGENSISGIVFILSAAGTNTITNNTILSPVYFNYNNSISGSSAIYNIYASQVENNCESPTANTVIRVASIPEPPTLLYTASYCNGLNPTPVTITGSGRIIHFYDNDAVTLLSSSGGNFFSFPSTITGQSGTFNYYFTQSKGVCTSPSATATITLSPTILPPPLDAGTYTVNPYCDGDNINDFKALPQSIFYSIKWKDASNNVLATGNSLNITFTGTTTGTDYRAYQFDNLSGCESSTFTGAQLVVYTKPPIPGITPANYFCSQTMPQSFLLSASTVSGNLLTWYTDKNLTSILGTGNNLNSGVDLSDRNTPIDDFYVTQTAFYTNPTKNCASDAAKLNISVYPTPQPVITRFAEVGTRFGLEDTLCTNDIKSNLPLQNLVFPQGGTFYINGVLSTDFNINPTPGLKRIRYFFSQTHAGINCPSDTSRYIRVLPLPAINFISGKLCVSDTVNLVSTTTVAGTDQISRYKWNVGSATRFSSDSLASVKIVFLNPSIYDMSLKVDTKYGCSDTKLFQPNVQPYPKLTFTSRNICLTDTTILESKLVLKDIFGSVNYYKYLTFYFGDGDSIRFDPINTNGLGSIPSRTFGNAQKIKHIYEQPGVFYQKIVAATTNSCDTSDVQRFFILPKISVTPGNDYVQNFESPNHGFVTSDSITSWQLGTPDKTLFTNAASGSKAWVTNLNGSYARNENTSVRCPCFDYSAINKPMISMTIRTNFPPNNVDGVVLQANDGQDNNWATVGNITSSDARDAGVNWYNAAAIVGNPGNQSLGQVGWSSDSSKSWRIARFKLDSLKDISQTRNLNTKSIRFRVAFGTSSSTVVSTNFNGFAFDDFSVLERDKILLVEHFTNTTGKTAKTDDQYIDDLTNLNRNDMVAIHYHTAFPGTDDFNTLNIADPSAKALFYGVDQVPYSVLSGNKYNGNTQGLRQNLIDTAFLQKAKFALTIDTPFATGNAYSLKIKATAVSSVSDPTALYVAIVERTIAGSNVTAANGQANFEWVMRKLVPDAAGTSISDVWSPSTVKNFIFSSSLDKVFDATQIGVIAFIQNKITKEVYQSAYVGPKAVIQSSGLQSTVTSIEKRLDSELISLYPNPGNDLVHILNKNAIAKDLHWVIYDQLGKLMKTGVLLSGIQLSEINTSLFPAGVYMIGFSDNVNATVYKKIVLIK